MSGPQNSAGDETPSTPGSRHDSPREDPHPVLTPRRASWWRAVRRHPLITVATVAAVVLAGSGVAFGYGLSSANADGRATETTAASATAVPAPSPTHTSTATAAPTQVATPTSSPTPSPFSPGEAAAPAFDVPPRPEAVLPVTCASIVPESVRVEVLGDPGTLLSGGGPASESGVASEWQSGVLRCAWANAALNISFALTVLPDALADFRSYSTVVGATGSTELGPDSRVQCDVTSPTSVWGCQGGYVPSGHWVEFFFSGTRPADAPAPRAVLTDVTAAVSSTLAAAGPSRPRVLAAGAPRGWTDCSQFDLAGFGSALDVTDLGNVHADVYGASQMEAAMRRAGLADCHWSSRSGLAGLTIDVVPGAGWTVTDLTAIAAKNTSATNAVVAVEGAQAASLTCYPGGSCEIRASVRGTLITVSTVTLPGSGRDPIADVTAAARFAVAHLPA